ncbi:MAG: pyridoxamine 5'-phosphate oxidase [Gammaproteobacteria bacterium]|nr:pyridoxamine 5'-phosphate oxidase [Gammaproteobacteria bacterium]
MDNKEKIFSKRKDYKVGKLVMSELNENPIEQFKQWLDQAINTDMPEPTAMNLSTYSIHEGLSSRMVLLKSVDEQGFVFYTNYDSRKAQDMAEYPQVALCFWWGALERQVRVEGKVEKVSEQESDDYFNSRPRGSQIGAIASKQSSVMNTYKELRDQVDKVEQKYQDLVVIPRPGFWGGYRVVPTAIEFWQGRPSRLHDRLKYIRRANGDWTIERLSP